MILNDRIHRLIVLSEELHFRRAAQRLHVSQPALSGSLKSLENELGARLFRRTSRNVELTGAGTILVSEARRLIEESERAITLIRECEPDLTGPVRFGYSRSMNLNWLGTLISEARKEGFLDADFRFSDYDASSLSAELDKRTLSGAFFCGRLRPFDQSSYQYVSLIKENMQAVVAADHKLATAGMLRIGDLRNQPVVWLRRDVDPVLYDTFTDLCAARGYRPNVVQETGSFYECLQFARTGVGITFLPSFMSVLSPGGALFVNLDVGFHVDYTMVYRKHATSRRPLDRFVRFVRDYVAEKKWSDA